MSTIVIEDISSELYAKLEQQAKYYRRPITQQIITLLEQALIHTKEIDSEKYYVKDLNILNQRAEQLNEEALDVLTYQEDL
ncbi:MAG: hypothetical protein ABFS56_20095 [Pseudomonadota bacterium]|jgi:hypothetical protein